MTERAPTFLSAVVLTWLCAAAAAADAQTFSVAWAHERLNVAARDAALADVLADVARQTGVTIVGLEKLPDRITVQVRNALLLDGLRTLLAGCDFIIRYSAVSDSLDRVKVWVRAPSNPASSTSRLAEAIRPPPSSPALNPPAASDDVPVDSIAAAPSPEPDPLPEVPNPTIDEVARLNAEGAFDARATESSLIGLTKSTNHEVRIRALQSLALQGTPIGMEAIKGALTDSNPFVRAEALDMLISQSPGPAAVGRLTELVEHADPAIRGTAAMALGDQAGDDADLILNRALEDADPSVRAFATQSLKQKQQKQLGDKPKR